MRHGRRDENHAEIRDKLRDVVGKQNVVDLGDVGDGVPDLLVGWRGQNFLLEIKKDRGKRKRIVHLKDTQVEFHASWHGQHAVVTTFAEALFALGIDPILAGAA